MLRVLTINHLRSYQQRREVDVRNAKEEFLEEIKDRQVLCAKLGTGLDFYDNVYEIEYILPVGYTDELYSKFLKSLDFEYDSGFGGQELYGFIWYTDGTWSERGEYDGSEWWEYKTVPAIPDELRLTKGEENV